MIAAAYGRNTERNLQAFLAKRKVQQEEQAPTPLRRAAIAKLSLEYQKRIEEERRQKEREEIMRTKREAEALRRREMTFKRDVKDFYRSISVRDAGEGSPNQPTIRSIIAATCAEYGVSVADVMAHNRHKANVLPRHVAMWRCKVLTTKSYPEIGRLFADRDHTSVLHAVKKIGRMVADGRLSVSVFPQQGGADI